MAKASSKTDDRHLVLRPATAKKVQGILLLVSDLKDADCSDSEMAIEEKLIEAYDALSQEELTELRLEET